jgi:peptidoglycan/LPS O-acetylase OafA/YrhL
VCIHRFFTECRDRSVGRKCKSFLQLLSRPAHRWIAGGIAISAVPLARHIGAMTRLPERSLDVLRATAVLCVLVDHVIVSQIGETLALWTLGRVGVLLFFVHTSLVLMASLERSGDSPLKFYIRRAFRIYPLSIATVLAVVALRLPNAVQPGYPTFRVAPLRDVVANLTLTQNLVGVPDVTGPLWSLPLEVQMYVVLPFCFLVAQRGTRAVLRLIGVACVLWTVQRFNVHLWRAGVLAFGPVFLLGVLAYAWLRSHTIGDLRPSRLTRVAHTLATYSYGIYLLHVPALAVAFVWGMHWPSAVQWCVLALLLFALPWVTYHVIEAPGITLGKRVAGWWSSRWEPAP